MDRRGGGARDAPEGPSRVLVHRLGRVVELELAAPPLNLVTLELLRDLRAALVAIAAGDDIRCVILHGGEARVFCAGSDMREFGDVAPAASERKILPEDLALRMLAALPMPTIAAIDGHALGGGLELSLACDLRIANEDALLGVTEARIGGLAGSGAVRLTRLVGPARAKEMLFTAEPVRAADPGAAGLVSRVVPGSALEAARAMADTIASRGPLSNHLAKRLVDAADDGPLDAALVRSTDALAEIFRSEDLHAGAAAFLAKTEPSFIGR